MRPSRLIAEQILCYRNDQLETTTPMHVIKLVYICHGWMLGIHGQSLIREAVEAWRYGPVVPSVYHYYKSYRGNPITRIPNDNGKEFEDVELRLVHSVLDAYRDYTALQLSAITHQEDTPWAIVYGDGSGEGSIIPNEIIRDYYERLANRE